MSEPGDHRVTQLLAVIGEGDRRAAEELLPLVYGELRRVAAARMAQEAPGHTLQATALVHEAYLRLVGDQSLEWDNRAHFFAAAAEAMRRILVENARRKARIRHGGGRQRVPLEPDGIAADEDSPEILAVDEALRRMEERDPRMGAVVKLRFFAGLSIEDTARALGVSHRTVRRDWTFAKAWLAEALGSNESA